MVMVLGALAVCGTVFWFIYTSLGPVDVPPPPPSRKALKFDAQADVSRNEVFGRLRLLVENPNLEPPEIGRPNPFIPVPKPQVLPAATSTTSTPSAAPTSTPLQPPEPPVQP